MCCACLACSGMIWSFSGRLDVLLCIQRFTDSNADYCLKMFYGSCDEDSLWVSSYLYMRFCFHLRILEFRLFAPLRLSVLSCGLFSLHLSLRGTMQWCWYSRCVFCIINYSGGAYGWRSVFVTIHKSAIGRSAGWKEATETLWSGFSWALWEKIHDSIISSNCHLEFWVVRCLKSMQMGSFKRRSN